MPLASFDMNVCKKTRFISCTFGCVTYLSKSIHSQRAISRSHLVISCVSGLRAIIKYKSEHPKPNLMEFGPPRACRTHTKLSNFVFTPVSSATSRMTASTKFSSKLKEFFSFNPNRVYKLKLTSGMFEWKIKTWFNVSTRQLPHALHNCTILFDCKYLVLIIHHQSANTNHCMCINGNVWR